MSQKTISEELFEKFCGENKIEFSRIEVSKVSGKKEPDYEIITVKGKILVEVKQFDPSEEELQLQKQLEERGWVDTSGKEPGAKVRLKIQSAAKQLKSRSAGSLPSLILLYNNVPISPRGTNPYEIKTAMYGLEKIDLSISLSESVPNIENRGSGPKQKMTPNSNTSVSAVAALYDGLDQGLFMRIFHNVYAAIPLPYEYLQGDRIKHFIIGEKVARQFQEWQEIREIGY